MEVTMRTEEMGNVGKDKALLRSTRTGLAWVEDEESGEVYSAHPYVFQPEGMNVIAAIRPYINDGDWSVHDSYVTMSPYVFNISEKELATQWNRIAWGVCQCKTCASRKRRELKMDGLS